MPMFLPDSPWLCGLVSVMGLVARCKDGSALVSSPQFLSSALVPKCCQWKARQSSALGGLGVYLPGKRGSGMSVCSWVFHSELGQDPRDVPYA